MSGLTLQCQQSAIEQLQQLADKDRHSILIEGSSGSGKTFLAKQFAELLGVADFTVIQPKVDAIRNAIDSLYNVERPCVLCIENLDTGVNGASYALLKFLEEPISNAYIVVTCRNIRGVPDTIVSRSTVVSVSPPRPKDISSYAEYKDATLFSLRCNEAVWAGATSFSDVDAIFGMSLENVQYFDEILTKFPVHDNVSNLMWALGHYPNNSETPLPMIIRVIMSHTNSSNIRNAALSCLKDLSKGRIASHAVLAKFCFDCKYTE